MAAAKLAVLFDLNILAGGFMVVGNTLPEQAAKRTFVFRLGCQSYRAQSDTAADSLAPPERGEGWGEGI
jgi:hypothetical protein